MNDLDENTRVRLRREPSGWTILIMQGTDARDEDTIELSSTGTPLQDLVQALLAANEAAGWEMPRLNEQGYESTDA